MGQPGGAYLEGHLDRTQLAASRWRVDQSFIEGMSGPDWWLPFRTADAA
jgi:hypothetical protein